jgi:hypothetical protein
MDYSDFLKLNKFSKKIIYFFIFHLFSSLFTEKIILVLGGFSPSKLAIQMEDMILDNKNTNIHTP